MAIPCPNCRRTTVQITLDRPAGPLTMHSCSYCDRRWWRRDTVLQPFEAVLEDLATTRRQKKAPAAA